MKIDAELHKLHATAGARGSGGGVLGNLTAMFDALPGPLRIAAEAVAAVGAAFIPGAVMSGRFEARLGGVVTEGLSSVG
jgi:hypothetical protein